VVSLVAVWLSITGKSISDFLRPAEARAGQRHQYGNQAEGKRDIGDYIECLLINVRERLEILVP
jgi:hypothetical protein